MSDNDRVTTSDDETIGCPWCGASLENMDPENCTDGEFEEDECDECGKPYMLQYEVLKWCVTATRSDEPLPQ